MQKLILLKFLLCILIVIQALKKFLITNLLMSKVCFSLIYRVELQPKRPESKKCDVSRARL